MQTKCNIKYTPSVLAIAAESPLHITIQLALSKFVENPENGCEIVYSAELLPETSENGSAQKLAALQE